MLQHPKMKKAFEQYSEEMVRSVAKSALAESGSVSDATDAQVKKMMSRSFLRKKMVGAFVRVGEGLAVAAVFCMMAYAVYIAAQGPKDPIVAATGETETQTESQQRSYC